MFGLGLPEMVIILIVIAIVFFGGEKVTGLARGLGRATGEFKKGKQEVEEEIKKAGKELRFEMEKTEGGESDKELDDKENEEDQPKRRGLWGRGRKKKIAKK